MTFESSFANFDENMDGFNKECRKSRRGLYLQVRNASIIMHLSNIFVSNNCSVVTYFFSSSETVIFLNLVTTISCQITTPKIGFIGLLIILLILELLVSKKMLSINASKALIFNDFKNCLNFSFKKISN